jgi:hypothetical protein
MHPDKSKLYYIDYMAKTLYERKGVIIAHL